MVQDIDPHILLLRLHYVRRVAQHDIELSKFRAVIENVRLDENRTAGTHCFEFRSEVLSCSHPQGLFRYVNPGHNASRSRQGQSPGYASGACAQVQHPYRLGILPERKPHADQPDRMSDSFTAEQFGFRTRYQDGRADIETAAVEFGLASDVLQRFSP